MGNMGRSQEGSQAIPWHLLGGPAPAWRHPAPLLHTPPPTATPDVRLLTQALLSEARATQGTPGPAAVVSGMVLFVTTSRYPKASFILRALLSGSCRLVASGPPEGAGRLQGIVPRPGRSQRGGH